MIEVQPAGWLSRRRDLLQVDQVDDVERRGVARVALQLELRAGRVRLRQQRVRLVEQPAGVGLRGVRQRLGVVGGAVEPAVRDDRVSFWAKVPLT